MGAQAVSFTIASDWLSLHLRRNMKKKRKKKKKKGGGGRWVGEMRGGGEGRGRISFRIAADGIPSRLRGNSALHGFCNVFT